MDIEMLGVNFIQIEIAKTDYLVAHINTNDKEPSWDGDIEVYRKASNIHAKKDLVLKVPIQVKGHKENNLKKKSISFPVEIADLSNYLNSGGTFFFVVYVHESGEKHQTYYAPLLPFELKKILAKHGHQKRKNITLHALPKDKIDISDLLLNFARDMKKQRPAITCDPVSLEDLVKDGAFPELSFGYSIVPREQKTPFDYMFNHGAYIYAKLPHGLELPVDHITSLESAQTTVDAPVCILGQQVYDSFDVVLKKDTIELLIGKSTKYIVHRSEDSQKLSFKLDGQLSDLIRDEDFLLNALAAGQFEVNGSVCSLRDIPPEELESFDLMQRQAHLAKLKGIKELLDCLKVHEELDVHTMSPKDVQRLEVLRSSILGKKTVPLTAPETGFGQIEVANLSILVCIIKKGNTSNLFDIHGINECPLDLTTEDSSGVLVPTSHYVLLKKQHFLSCCNIDYPSLLRQVKNVPFSSKYAEQTVALLLEMLKAYDENPSLNIELLPSALSLAEWMRETDSYTPKEILDLNYYQIIKRMRSFEKEERDFLLHLVEDGLSEEEYYVASYLLLDNQEAAHTHFSKMNPTTQENFCTLPIYHFWIPPY